jgi:transposase
VPPALSAVLSVIVTQIEAISEAIEQCDQQIEELCTKLTETRWLHQVPGVGALTAATFALTIDNPDRFARSCDPSLESIVFINLVFQATGKISRFNGKARLL